MTPPLFPLCPPQIPPDVNITRDVPVCKPPISVHNPCTYQTAMHADILANSFRYFYNPSLIWHVLKKKQEKQQQKKRCDLEKGGKRKIEK